jgi:tetratricopeptide (TPR) repeat protein
LGNYPKALENHLLKLKIEESRQSPRNYASALSNIGITYILLEDYKNALSYLYRADSVVNAEKIPELKYSIMVNLGETYYRLNRFDSATAYFNKSLHIAEAKNNDDFKAISHVGVANVFLKEDSLGDALQNYHHALMHLQNGSNEDLVCEASLGAAKAYDKMNKNDSAQYFARMSMDMAIKDGFVSRRLDAASLLAAIFNKIKRSDSAFIYLQQSIALKDTIKGQDKTRQAQIISIDEQLRQAQMAEQKQREKEERRKQMQLLLIGIFIPIFFLVTIFVSRRIVQVRVIKFLGIISLLLLFEYLTLLMHPFVADITGHTPLLEILIFVTLASLLIPGHHRLEAWLISLLTRKRQPYMGGQFKLKTRKIKSHK